MTHECKHTRTYMIAPGRRVSPWQHTQMSTKEGEWCLPLVQQGAIYLNGATKGSYLYYFNETRAVFWEMGGLSFDVSCLLLA